jgi:hypothetical protein
LTRLRTLLPIDFYVDMSRSGENYRAPCWLRLVRNG